jgi:sugar (pentulose or hexulose) kinase
MRGVRHVAVIDIGKTNAKVALVDVINPGEIAIRKTANSVVRDGPYPHHDVERLWEFILDGLAVLNGEHPVDAISVTAHGATAALLGHDGRLALPVLDYEHDGPDALRDDYGAVRPSFEETGSPCLPNGLNLGAQLFWQQRSFSDTFAKVASILMYPQYWSFRLSGTAANEVTSLGCHTDLWNPVAADFSGLVDRMGWRALMAPVRRASDRLGPVLPEIARRTGLDPETPVLCGIHDSNASLLPHVLSRKPPFAVVSTGTWVVAMAIGAAAQNLDPARDTLVNVNALGEPVPSARFMGGREYSMLTADLKSNPTDSDIAAVLSERILLLPSVQPGSGPFPGQEAQWISGREVSVGERGVVASFYLAMMSASCLDLIGADGATIVEGPFAGNELYCRMLAAATGRDVVANTGGGTGTSLGAALLAADNITQPAKDGRLHRCPNGAWADYNGAWQAATHRLAD